MKATRYTLCRCILIFCALFFSCKNRTDLDIALTLAGDNRAELEQVLNHYKHDTLKYKAARFLIENMPGHYSYADDRINDYYRETDTILSSSYMNPTEKMKAVEEIAEKYSGLNSNIIEDVKIIKADFLIRNIDQAFEDWKGQRILRHITFEQFCEYMLPYKVMELQQLDCWRDSLRGKYSTRYRNDPLPTRLQLSVSHATNAINSEINSKFPQNHIQGNYYRFLSASNIDKMPFGQCDEYTTLATAILRSEGLPVIREDLMQWGNKPLGHSWYSMINSDGNILPYYWGLLVNAGSSFFVDEPVPKVFRHTYSRNERPLTYLRECKNRPLSVSLFKKDVTSEYIVTSDISVPITNEEYRKEKWAYIAVFDNQRWVLVDYGQIKSNRANFVNIGRNIAYLVFGYDGRHLTPISDPFILHTNGELEYLIPDKGKVRSMDLTRKYPMTDHTLLVEQRIVGGKIEASETKDFTKSITFHEIKTEDKYKILPTNTTDKYRYWRYVAPRESYGNIAEIEFYEQGSKTPARGDIIGTQDVYHGNEEWSNEKGFDGDWLTYVSVNQLHHGWVGLDFGKPVNIEKFRCIPRSDDNAIHTGDEYELFYWNNHDWVSLGRKVGETHVLTFDNVPEKALLLLRNQTRGKEERIFTYVEGKQIWW